MKLIPILILVSFFALNEAIAQWVVTNVPSNVTVQSIATNDGNIYAGTDGNGIYHSTDGGANWSQLSTGLTTQKVTAIGFSGPYIFVGTNGNGVYRSSDQGGSWAQANFGLSNLNIRDLTVHISAVFAATNGGGVFRSLDSAKTWVQVNAGFAVTSVRSLLAHNTFLFAGTQGDGVYRTNNNGDSWTRVSNGLPPTTDYFLLSANSTTLFVGTGLSYFRSVSNGDGWADVGQIAGASFVTALHAGESSLFAGTYVSGVFRNSVGDTGWITITNGLTNTGIRSLALVGNYLYTGTTGGLWRRPTSEITFVKRDLHPIPRSYTLEQNYPNPFNPSTAIEFSIPHSGMTTLNIFNLLGEEVEALVAGELSAGRHLVKWDAKGKASGIYFYRLQAGEFTETKKLILLQ
jgi:photosystem II stability/assembly factor-like uncharacterized protein